MCRRVRALRALLGLRQSREGLAGQESRLRLLHLEVLVRRVILTGRGSRARLSPQEVRVNLEVLEVREYLLWLVHLCCPFHPKHRASRVRRCRPSVPGIPVIPVHLAGQVLLGIPCLPSIPGSRADRAVLAGRSRGSQVHQWVLVVRRHPAVLDCPLLLVLRGCLQVPVHPSRHEVRVDLWGRAVRGIQSLLFLPLHPEIRRDQECQRHPWVPVVRPVQAYPVLPGVQKVHALDPSSCRDLADRAVPFRPSFRRNLAVPWGLSRPVHPCGRIRCLPSVR